jgi:hypothetical protein
MESVLMISRVLLGAELASTADFNVFVRTRS